MSRPEAVAVRVWCEMGGASIEVGTAYVTERRGGRRGVVSARFVYDEGYVRRSDAFAISPDLPLADGGGTTEGLPGALADSAPDRWGRTLIQKGWRSNGPASDGRPTAPLEVDFLLGVSDVSRQGALHYTVGESGFLAEGHSVPKLIELPRLLHAADVAANDGVDDGAAVQELLDAGSASLGGARPKASVRDGDGLFIAKFPHRSDEWNVMAWEKVALDLAERAGIRSTPRRMVDVGGRGVLLVERFDRQGDRRLPYISAMSLLGSRDGESRDYLEIAEAIGDHGGTVLDDLVELWHRIAFSVAINNVDDHLRNHGLLRAGSGWSLSPVFDVNPNPEPGAGRVTSIAFAVTRRDALASLLDSAGSFGMTADQAAERWARIRSVVYDWRAVARVNGIAESEIRRFAPVFDADL